MGQSHSQCDSHIGGSSQFTLQYLACWQQRDSSNLGSEADSSLCLPGLSEEPANDSWVSNLPPHLSLPFPRWLHPLGTECLELGLLFERQGAIVFTSVRSPKIWARQLCYCLSHCSHRLCSCSSSNFEQKDIVSPGSGARQSKTTVLKQANPIPSSKQSLL